MSDPKSRRLKHVNWFLGGAATLWYLGLIAATLGGQDPMTVAIVWVVTLGVTARVGLLLRFSGTGTVEQVNQKIVRTEDEDGFTHANTRVILKVRLSNGMLKTVRYGTLFFAMETGVKVGSRMAEKRWAWTWINLDPPVPRS